MTNYVTLENIRDAIGRLIDERSVGVVAEMMDVHHQVLRDFVSAKVVRPRGENWERIRTVALATLFPHGSLYLPDSRSAAEDSAAYEIPDLGALESAEEETAANIVRLSKISGYAEFVLQHLRLITSQQELVVERLKPWIQREKDDERTRMLRAKLDAADHTDPATTPAEEQKRRKGRGQ